MDRLAVPRGSSPMSLLTSPPDSSQDASSSPVTPETVSSFSLNIAVESDTYTMLLNAQASTSIPGRTSGRLAAQRAQTAIKRAFITGLGLEETDTHIKRSRTDEHDMDENEAYGHVDSKDLIGNIRPSTIRLKNPTAELVDRPQSVAEPQVWANGRGSLCEALPYFRAFKGSLHSAAVVAQGFLIDQEVDHGDVFSAQVVISSVGGGRVKDPSTGNMVRAKDATDSAPNVRSFKNAYDSKCPVAVIAGENHPLYPCQPPHPYAVLGYFHITYMWKEKQVSKGTNDAVLVWRIRLEKADLTEPSWWMPKGEDMPQPTTTHIGTIVAPMFGCDKCGVKSKEIFTAGWFCLNHLCEQYYTLPSGVAVDPRGLTYTEAFIGERTPFTGDIPSIKPAVPDEEGLHGTELALRRGFVCPDCGCCNRRVYWNRWVCENKQCQYTRPAQMMPYPKEILDDENTKFDAAMDKRRKTNGVNENALNEHPFLYDPVATIFQRGYLRHSQTLTLGGYQVRQYFLPDSQGRILGSFSIFSSSPEINAKPGGADELFTTLEVTDIGLRRNPAAVVGHKLEGYTRHFQQNFGARYKFGVSVQSKGFDEAPDVVLRALHRLIWAKKVAVPASNGLIQTLPKRLVGSSSLVEESNDFNELLALGYMEDDKINYHDDGESELGPVVAALALGSPSTMRFRPKRRTQFFLPTHMEHGKCCYKEVLEVTMKHGDMMVMIGPDIQRVYEHTVDPYGKRRFSLTARYIDPLKMLVQADRDDAAIKGAIPEHAKAFTYDGY